MRAALATLDAILRRIAARNAHTTLLSSLRSRNRPAQNDSSPGAGSARPGCDAPSATSCSVAVAPPADSTLTVSCRPSALLRDTREETMMRPGRR